MLKLPTFVTRAPVSTSCEEVTSIARDREVDPHSVGVDPAALERVWKAVEACYRDGIHPAIQLCVRRRGRVLLDRAIGHAHGGGPGDRASARKVAVTTETPFNAFSASKSVTAMVIHLLEQKRRLHLDDPICDYIPEFARHGKENVTIRHVLAHRSGIPNTAPEWMRLELLARPDEIVRILCDAKPIHRAGHRSAYHAISGGFVLGEIVRRVVGADIRTVLAKEILEPLGFRWMNYGVRTDDVPRVASNYFTGMPVLPPASWMFRRILGVDFAQVATMGNDPRYLTGVVPAGNVVTTADELSRFYQLLLDGGVLDGVRVFEPATIRRAVAEQSGLELDRSLGMPIRYSLGFVLGGQRLSIYGPDSADAFGHPGYVSVLGWADPRRRIAVGLMTSGKPFLYPELPRFFAIFRELSHACPKEQGFDWWRSISRADRVRSTPVRTRRQLSA